MLECHKSRICLLALMGINFAQQESGSSREKPRVNVYGTLSDQADQVIDVENIVIGDLYKQIPFYAKPSVATIEPESNTTYIDLVDIAELGPRGGQYPNENTFVFNNRHYIEITIVLKGKEHLSADYLVETTRRIWCDFITSAGPIQKQLSFDALKKLVIKGYVHREERPEKAPDSHKSMDRSRQCAEAGKKIHELEIEVKKIEESDHKSFIRSLIDSLKNWIGGICGTEGR